MECSPHVLHLIVIHCLEERKLPHLMMIFGTVVLRWVALNLELKGVFKAVENQEEENPEKLEEVENLEDIKNK
jgi:hypothetical protein